MKTGDEVIDELSTVADFVRWAASRFAASDLAYGHGTDNAADEAHYLVQEALDLAPDFPSYFRSARLTRAERDSVATLIERRITERLPVAYLVHRAWFMGLPFYVDERVLVPRSPIAELLERQCTPWVDPAGVHRILDLCTGSGCIAAAAAMVFPAARVDASDLSADALNVARKNILAHGLGERVKLLRSDGFSAIPQARYQLILSNPPYVGAEEMQSLPPEYRHEPSLALESGDNGLELVTHILAHAGRYLDADGVLIMEVGNSEDALKEAFPDVPFTWIEFDRGGSGVFVLTAAELAACTGVFERAS